MIRKPFDTGIAQLDHELLGEMASELGRAGRRLEAALQALHAFDQANETRTEAVRAARRPLVDAAAQALWRFVVQREACGLRDQARIVRDYKVPPEVVGRMGAGPG